METCRDGAVMDRDRRKFGRGPRELTGGVDLISHYRLQPHLKYFCKKTLPVSITGTNYLHNAVGDAEIRKGVGMELNQLLQKFPCSQETTSQIQPFDLDALQQAFQLRESAPIELSSQAEKGRPTICGKVKGELEGKRKHRRHRDKDGKGKEHKKQKHHHKDHSKDRGKDKEKKDETGHHDSGGNHSKKHHSKYGHRRIKFFPHQAS